MDLSDWASAKVKEVIVNLLETKHLYQSLRVNKDRLLEEAVEQGLLKPIGAKEALEKALLSDWQAHDETSVQRPCPHSMPDGTPLPPRIAFFVRNISAPCAKCKIAAPMNLISCVDLHRDPGERWQRVETPAGEQDFVFLFECQSCRSSPDAFLLRRQELRLTLCGRAPMERVAVPDCIPRAVQKYYSNATVAFQSGQVLAALSLLRVVIEQHAHGAIAVDSDLRADEAIDAYMASLPAPLRAQYPSFRELYGHLSSAIHSAKESESLFQRSSERIAIHFEGVRLFERMRQMDADDSRANSQEPAEHPAGADG